MTLRAYAKVNLYLDILSRREDNYHTILSVMHRAPVFDMVSVQPSPSGVEVTCSDPSLAGSDNICHRAAERFFTHYGGLGGAVIHIEKNIPLGAGLGGGSADAAAVLRGLNALYGHPLALCELMELAVSIGADVPFCLSGYKCAVCEGIGEVVTAIPSTLSVGEIKIQMPSGGGVSTKEAYALYDAAGIGRSAATAEVLKGLIVTPENVGSLLYNVFERVIFPVRPEIAALKEAMRSQGMVALMSGSGAAVFGIM